MSHPPDDIFCVNCWSVHSPYEKCKGNKNMKFVILFVVLLSTGGCAVLSTNTMKDCTELCKKSNAQLYENGELRCICGEDSAAELKL